MLFKSWNFPLVIPPAMFHDDIYFLGLPVQGLGRQSEPPHVSSPTESLRDKLYRKTKHVLDYTVTDAIGRPPGESVIREQETESHRTD